jgi:hypothetical protein
MIYFLLIITSLSIIFPFGMAIWRYKYLPTSGKVLYAYLWVSIIIFEIAAWYTSLNGIQNHFLFNIFSPIEFLLLSCIYWLEFKTLRFRRILVVIVSLIFSFQVGSNIIFWESFNRFNSVANALPNLGLMFFVILYFYELLKEQEVISLSSFPMFWISSGIIFYVSINFFLFIFGEFVTFNSSAEIYNLDAIIPAISNITYRIFLTIGLWFSKTPPQLSPSSK